MYSELFWRRRSNYVIVLPELKGDGITLEAQTVIKVLKVLTSLKKKAVMKVSCRVCLKNMTRMKVTSKHIKAGAESEQES
jgi:hypothetical protein